jgi:hypothetical protein
MPVTRATARVERRGRPASLQQGSGRENRQGDAPLNAGSSPGSTAGYDEEIRSGGGGWGDRSTKMEIKRIDERGARWGEIWLDV